MSLKDIARRIPLLVPAVRGARLQVEAWRLANRQMGDVFTEIYRRNRWGGRESASGTGSDLQQTAVLVRELPDLFRRHGIASMLDIPCGDFHWMKRVDLAGIDYVGADIVPELVAANQAAFGRPGVAFVALNLANDPLPATDLVFCRDCLVHLSYEDVDAALRNICASDARFLLATTFPAHRNRQIRTGQWRPLNLQAPPFSLPAPIELIDEKCTEGEGEHRDKSMGLWSIAQLRSALATV